MLDVLTRSHTIYGRAVSPGGSVGVAVYPDDAADAGDLQRFADMALYRVKMKGGRRWSAFDAELREENERRRTLEAELRRGIPAGEIEPWFQPVVDLKRWPDRRRRGCWPAGGIPSEGLLD